MLRDMAEQRFEQNILLPYIIEFDASIGVNDSTDNVIYIFNRCPHKLSLRSLMIKMKFSY